MLFAFGLQKLSQPLFLFDKPLPLIDGLQHTRLAHLHLVAHVVDHPIVLYMALKPMEVALYCLDTSGFFVQVGNDEDLCFEEVQVVLLVL